LRTVDGALLQRADVREATARRLIDDLGLVREWSALGRPVVVGSVAHGLVVSPDIDMEVFCPEPSIADGFAVLARLAEHRRVRKARFWNDVEGPNLGLYWQLRCLDDDGAEWKVDTWTVAEDHPGPLAAWLVEPMSAALSPEARAAVLSLKEARARGDVPSYPSIEIYRAVIDHGVCSPAELVAFLGDGDTGLSRWLPWPATPEGGRRRAAHEHLVEAFTQRRRHRWKVATTALERAAGADPEWGEAWFWLAVTRDQRGREVEAIDAYRRALACGLADRGRRAQAWTWLASSLAKTGAHDDALSALAEADHLGGYSPRTQWERIAGGVRRRSHRSGHRSS